MPLWLRLWLGAGCCQQACVPGADAGFWNRCHRRCTWRSHPSLQVVQIAWPGCSSESRTALQRGRGRERGRGGGFSGGRVPAAAAAQLGPLKQEQVLQACTARPGAVRTRGQRFSSSKVPSRHHAWLAPGRIQAAAMGAHLLLGPQPRLSGRCPSCGARKSCRRTACSCAGKVGQVFSGVPEQRAVRLA